MRRRAIFWRVRAQPCGPVNAIVTITLLTALLYYFWLWPVGKLRRAIARLDTQLTDLGDQPPRQGAVDLPVYYVSREADRHRRASVEKQLQRLQPPIARRVPGVEGSLHIKEDWSHSGFKWNAAGELGCTLSHLAAARQLILDGHEAALVVEDDARFDLASRWPFSLTQLIDQLPPDWTTLQLYHGSHTQPPRDVGASVTISPCSPGMTGTLAYILSRRGADSLMRLTHGGRALHRVSLGTRSGQADVVLFEFPGAQAFALWPRYVFPYNDMDRLKNRIHAAHKHTLEHIFNARTIVSEARTMWHYPASARTTLRGRGERSATHLDGLHLHGEDVDNDALMILTDFVGQ
mmetsp:Transcript_12647/g.38053  ORF Transcript_12647/g.38053 Transcript_12647/m.38053 type:complete len:349 (-) Transcript_12647:166-1212(-)